MLDEVEKVKPGKNPLPKSIRTFELSKLCDEI